MTERICAWRDCDQPLVRGEREKNCSWNKRQCCSRICARRLAGWRSMVVVAAKKRGAYVAPDTNRVCEAPGCDNLIVRRKGEPDSGFAGRQCCSKACGRKLQTHRRWAELRSARAGFEHEPCVMCQGAVTQRSGEDWWAYARRKTCSDKCANAQRGKQATGRKFGPRKAERAVPDTPPFDGIGSFAAHNIVTNDGGRLWATPYATHVLTQASS